MSHATITAMMSRLTQSLLFLCLLFTAAGSQAVERVTYYHNDALGSPVAATDASGTLLWREEYAPYGERLTQEPASSENTAWYTGKQEESTFGISYFGARWYDPAIGRFMAVDPVGFSPDNTNSFSKYAYANNNPYVYVDPDGNVVETALDIVSFGLSLAAFNSEPSLLNALGLAYDGAATVIPFLPAGFGVIKNIGNGIDAAGDVIHLPHTDKFGNIISRNPKSIQDQMTLDAAKQGEGIVKIPSLGDSKYKGMQKMELETISAEGKKSKVHYVRDPATGNSMDFKFKKHSTD